jgi:tetratricopeptide (TPR) repeat protein
MVAWARLCEQRGMLEQALSLYKAESELFDTTGALRRAAVVAMQLGRDEDAGALSARSFEADPKTPASLFIRSVFLQRGGDEQEARKLMADADALALARGWQRGSLTLLMERYGMAEAAHHQRQMIVQAGRFARLDLTAADLYAQRMRQQGRRERARWLMEHQALGMMGMGPEAPAEILMSGYEYRDIYGVIELLEEDEPEAAAELARTVVGRSPGLADSLILLINALDSHGQREVADELFETIWQAHEARLELFPGEASHYNTQAWVGTRCGRKLDSSLELSQKSLEMDPFSPYFLDTLADVYFMRGDAEKALENERLSVSVEPSSFTWRQYHRFKDAVD